MNREKQINVGFYEALKSHYEAQIKKHVATLELYLTDPLAVADHPELLDVMKDQTRCLAEAEEALSTLTNTFEARVIRGE